ncbi:unnamed protein product [Parajaminaea phylloscopi]
MADEGAGPSNSQLESIPPRSEYRFELEPGERLSIRLIPDSGDAEIFGAELLEGEDRWYTFGEEAKGCVCSWNGCQIEIAPPPSAAYLSLEPSPTFSSYSTLHLHLEKSRLQARQTLRSASSQLVNDLRSASEGEGEVDGPHDLYRPDGQGPRILLLGPESSGKSSLARFLCNYALRSPATTATGHEEDASSDSKGKDEVKGSEPTGWWPVLVNLDAGSGAFPLPGSISASPLSPLPQAALGSGTPAIPFGLTTPVSGALPPTALAASAVSSVALWLGREQYRENDEHGKAVLSRLAQHVEKRMCRDMKARMSGLVIDTPGTTSIDSKSKYAMIRDIVRCFRVDTILVMGHEKVTIDLTRIYASSTEPGPKPVVLKLPKSGGVAEADESYKARLRSNQVRTYFYGGSGGVRQAKSSGPQKGANSADNLSVATEDKKMPGSEDPLGNLSHLNPYTQTIPLDLLEVYRVGQETMAPTSALPIGASRALSASTLHQLDPVNSAADQSALLHSVLALVEPPAGGGGKGQKDSEVWKTELGEGEGEAQVAVASIRGFVHVQSIDVAKKRMTVLAPSAGRLPSKTALLGSLDWQDA